MDRVITQSFLQLDHDIMSLAARAIDQPTLLADANAMLEAAYSGSCALVAYYIEETRSLKVACVGDSRAVLGRKNAEGIWEAILLSHDQTGHNEAEAKRLQADHPDEPDMLKNGRLLGLAVTRAFGDARWKWSQKTQEIAQKRFFGPEPRVPLISPPYLTAEPVITTTEIFPERGDFLIMASDGMWDNLSSEQAVKLVGNWRDTHDLLKEATPSGKIEIPDRWAPSDLSKTVKPSVDREFTKPKILSEKDMVNVDDNAATHLARHALGGGDLDLLTGLISSSPPWTRRMRFVSANIDLSLKHSLKLNFTNTGTI
ncbi:uncharacterized protein KY384_008234 [Bacidia gigantensis]|uniref:uncharacterized protein n=1 Tax=Bacidia gigantensis TaxID=2732470 RepID=UPI001D05670F|nr:uncharacterized protein KY384_008234 [Bacidia gigantensis]KAG8526805.1 hypothetical protein KY384_008234 [Bacidia gigantensis]